MSNPWMKFYPTDYRGDQALRAVSLAARGLWMEMLCIMHEASPYGHLLLGGKSLGYDALARMSGAGVEETTALIGELESAGVFRRTKKGVIYSKRMTKDHGRSEKGRKSVQKRWAQQPEKQEKNDTPNRAPNSPPITQKPEARSSDDKSSGETPTIAEQIWGWGLAYLKECGIAEKSARSLLGKWRNSLGEPGTLAALAHCQANSTSDPTAYIEGIARKQAKPEDDRKAWLQKKYGKAA